MELTLQVLTGALVDHGVAVSLPNLELLAKNIVRQAEASDFDVTPDTIEDAMAWVQTELSPCPERGKLQVKLAELIQEFRNESNALQADVPLVVAKKSRHVRTQAKLTEAQALAILTATGTLEAVAKQFGCSPSTVSLIRAGKTWKHLQALASTPTDENTSQDVPVDPGCTEEREAVPAHGPDAP